jgi:hypothetical protein
VNDLERPPRSISHGLKLVTFQEYVFGFKVGVSEAYRVQELKCPETLRGDTLNLPDRVAIVLVVLDEIVETLSKGLEHKAHVLPLTIPMVEVLPHIHDTFLSPPLLCDVSQDLRLSLRTLIVPLNCPDYLNSVSAVAYGVKALEGPTKSAVSQQSINLS